MTDTKPTLHRPASADIERLMARRSYGVLSTVSPAGHPHAAGVLYEKVGGALYLNTTGTSRKARNIEANPRVAMVVPVRRLPIGGPPSAVQFQATASVETPDSDTIRSLVSRGELGSITGHGELELPDSVFVRIELPSRLITYGLGMPLWELIRHPLDAGGVVER